MRIATWNVNSLKARLEKVEWWLERAAPDVLLLQETKLSDDTAPLLPFSLAGYELVHHGEGRWNGVAIASRVGIADVVTNFGDGAVRPSFAAAAGPGDAEDFDPSREARMVSAVCGGVRVVSLYAPNGRIVGSPFYAGKLAWFARVRRWLDETADPGASLVIGGDLNVAPADLDVWDPALAHGGTHVSEPERAAFRALLDWGLEDAWRARNPALRRFTWWDAWRKRAFLTSLPTLICRKNSAILRAKTKSGKSSNRRWIKSPAPDRTSGPMSCPVRSDRKSESCRP